MFVRRAASDRRVASDRSTRRTTATRPATRTYALRESATGVFVRGSQFARGHKNMSYDRSATTRVCACEKRNTKCRRVVNERSKELRELQKEITEMQKSIR